MGYRSIRGLNDALPDFDGPVASVDLALRLLGSSTIGLTTSRGVEFSFEILDPYYVSARYGGSVRHQFTELFGLSVGAQRFRHSYRQFKSSVVTSPTGGVDTRYNRKLCMRV